jgi:Zn-dependent peptidase ImmA (M78 family)
MRLIKPHIVKTAREFWSKIDQKINPPYDISGAVNLILPIDIISLSELSLRRIEQWLKERSIFLNIEVDDRDLHGFILFFRGSGFIFINGTDHEDERRYTIAHEASHFILEYQQPRDKAIKKLGNQIKEVLDGYREPTPQERIDGLITAVNLQPFMHLLEKAGDGSFNSIKIFNSENDADDLALELLAPNSYIIKGIVTSKEKLPFEDFKERCFRILMKKYKLPESIAKQYSVRLAYVATGAPSILSKLGF